MAKRFVEEIKGKPIVGAAGRIFGEALDVGIDFETSRVTDLIVIVSSSAVQDLGLNKPFWHRARMTLPISCVASVADVVLLNITMEEYGQRLQSAVPEPPRMPEALQ